MLGAAAWSNGIGPVGAGLADGVRWIIGALVMVLPVVLFFPAALRLLRRGPRPEARGRLADRLALLGSRRSWASRRSPATLANPLQRSARAPAG